MASFNIVEIQFFPQPNAVVLTEGSEWIAVPTIYQRDKSSNALAVGKLVTSSQPEGLHGCQSTATVYQPQFPVHAFLFFVGFLVPLIWLFAWTKVNIAWESPRQGVSTSSVPLASSAWSGETEMVIRIWRCGNAALSQGRNHDGNQLYYEQFLRNSTTPCGFVFLPELRCFT